MRNCRSHVSSSIVFLLVTLLFYSPGARAQGNEERGSVAGVVTDTAGARIDRAQVSLLNAQQIVLGTTETDIEGRYSFAGVQAGTYVVSVSRGGFAGRLRGAPHLRPR